MNICNGCNCEEDEQDFREIDGIYMCEDCYDNDRPICCIQCEFESYDSSLFREDQNEDDECRDCCESGRFESPNKLYMISR